MRRTSAVVVLLLAGAALCGCAFDGSEAPVSIEGPYPPGAHLSAEEVTGVLDQLAGMHENLARGISPKPPAYVFDGVTLKAIKSASGAVCVAVGGLPAGPMHVDAAGVDLGDCPDGRLVWKRMGADPTVVIA